MLADVAFPDLQPVIVEDISEMAIGHLGGGLLLAHGLDEGGQPDLGIGGHDLMWFLAAISPSAPARIPMRNHPTTSVDPTRERATCRNFLPRSRG